MNILGIIPARAGSKRVPQKNFRPFAGTTLTDLAIQQAIQSNRLTHIALSSDSDKILELGKKQQEIICLKRPAELSTDESPAIDYVRHCLLVLEPSLNLEFDIVTIIQPSSPLRRTEDIDATIELLLRHPEADSAVSVTRVKHDVHPVKFKVMKGVELLPYLEEEEGRFSREQLPEVYVRNCAVYATWRKDLETRADIIGKRSIGYVMPAKYSIDINDPSDFDFAEYTFLRRVN